MWPFKEQPDEGILQSADMKGSKLKQGIRLGKPQSISPIYVASGDSLYCTFTRSEGDHVVHKESMPPALFNRALMIDTLVRLEVIDEFGLDVGVGFLAGEAKK